MEYAEFEAGLQKNPALLDTIFEKHAEGATKYLTERGGRIVTTAEDFARDRDTAIGEGSKKAHEAWESKIFELTGVKKNDGEKGLDYYDRVKAQIKYLKAGEDDTPEGRANKTALTTLQEELKVLKKQLADKDQAVFSANVNAAVGTGVRSLKIAVPAHIKDDAGKTAYTRDQVSANIALFNSLYTPEARQDGTVQFKDKQGNVLVNSDGEPLSVEEIFAKNHSHLLAPKGFSQGGTGAAGDDPNAGKADYLGKDAEAIQQKLAEMGLAFMSPEWEDKYRKALAAIGRKL